MFYWKKYSILALKLTYMGNEFEYSLLDSIPMNQNFELLSKPCIVKN